MAKMSVDERIAKCAQFELQASRYGSWDLAASIGGEVCGIAIGSVYRSIKQHHELLKHIEEWTSRNGPEPLVRMSRGLCFRARDDEGLSVREFRVLAAIYSSIGASRFRAVPEPVIRVRAIGCKCASLINAANGPMPSMLSVDKIRGTVTRLHELGFYARVTPLRYGRKTFYSHRLTDSELRERLLATLTYSKKFADERRRKDQDLSDQIRKQKIGYDSEPNRDHNIRPNGEWESSPQNARQDHPHGIPTHPPSESRRDPDYDKKPFNKKPFNKKPFNDTHEHSLALGIYPDFSALSESEKAILDVYNRFARTQKRLGFREVDELTDEVQKALEVFESRNPNDFIELLKEEANNPSGGRTFVRCCWNNY
jgi:hypothetical protein